MVLCSRRLPQGVDCFGAFMQSGLPKEMLKAVWDLVAGDAGQLSRHQFVQVCVGLGAGCAEEKGSWERRMSV